MTDPAAHAARSAAATLAPDLGASLPAQVEAALLACNTGEQRPGQFDPLAIAGAGSARNWSPTRTEVLLWLVSNSEQRSQSLCGVRPPG